MKQIKDMDREKLYNDLDRMMLLFEASNEGLFDMDKNGDVRFYNKSFYSNFDIDPDHSTLDDWLKLIHPEDREQFNNSVNDQVSNHIVTYKSEYKVLTKMGGYIWIEAYGIAEYDEEDELISMMGSHRDISDSKIHEDRIYNLAYVDGLTGLYNRSKLDEMLIMHLSMKEPGALIYLNINQFKLVNDTYGEDTGNRVLIRVAERLKQSLNENCVVFRLHADEFAILITDPITTDTLKKTISKLQDVLEGRVTLKEKVLDISTSVGVCELPMDVNAPEELVQRAKLTMRYGRQLSKNRCAFFDEGIEKSVMQELHIETGLRSALEANELYLNYQPIVSAKDGRLVGLEALVRWKSHVWGEIYPDQFIPVAERTLEIIEIGNFVLEKACEFINSLRADLNTSVKVSVNVSVVQLVQSDFVEQVLRIVNKTKANPESLVLEITESVTFDTNEVIIERLETLKNMGISIALDDFGTGYSSVNNLMTIPMRTLKVDRKVMEKAMENFAIKRFVTSVVKLCHEMELVVVAEGIEDEVMVDKARLMNVDFFQGYYYSRPLSEQDMRSYARESMLKFK